MAHRGTIRTADGYTLYHLADGSVVDSYDDDRLVSPLDGTLLEAFTYTARM